MISKPVLPFVLSFMQISHTDDVRTKFLTKTETRTTHNTKMNPQTMDKCVKLTKSSKQMEAYLLKAFWFNNSIKNVFKNEEVFHPACCSMKTKLNNQLMLVFLHVGR